MFQPFLLKPGTSSSEVLKVIRVLTNEKKWGKAEIVARQGLRAFPKNHELFIEFTKILAETNRHTDAITALQGGINSSPLEPNLYLELQNHYFRMRDFKSMEVNHKNFLNAWSRGLRNVHRRRKAMVFYGLSAVLSLYRSDYSAIDRWSAQLLAAKPIEAASKTAPRRTIATSQRPHVGFISTQITGHAVSRFIGPLLLNLTDRNKYTLFYDIDEGTDKGLSKTEQFLHKAHSKINIVKISSDSAKESCSAIQKEEVDILIELAGHFSGAPTNILAMKPAPIQASWIGYPSHPGLSCIDYFLTDSFCQPETDYLGDFRHKIYQFGRFFSIYEDETFDDVKSDWQPAEMVRFGSFNNINKLSHATLETWAQVLKNLPQSTLNLKFVASYPYELDQIKRFFHSHGLLERVAIMDTSPNHSKHLEQYSHIDIALDTFPYCGTTTTCEALNMGVPVVTLLGGDHVSRVGAGILRSVGCEELIATSEQDYVQKAVTLAIDSKRLKHYHKSLKDMFLSSPLSDVTSMVAAFEGFIEFSMSVRR